MTKVGKGKELFLGRGVRTLFHECYAVCVRDEGAESEEQLYGEIFRGRNSKEKWWNIDMFPEIESCERSYATNIIEAERIAATMYQAWSRHVKARPYSS